MTPASQQQIYIHSCWLQCFARIWRKLTMCITVKNEAVKSSILIQHFIKTTKWTSFQCNLNNKASWFVFWWHFDAHRYEYRPSCKLFVVCRILTIRTVRQFLLNSPTKKMHENSQWRLGYFVDSWTDGVILPHTPQGWKCAHTNWTTNYKYLS